MPVNNLRFTQMFEVAGLQALYPGIENGEPFTKIMPSLGLYADRHFLYYGHDGVATAYYERSDIDEAGVFTFDRFSNPSLFEDFVTGAETAVTEIARFLHDLANTDVETLSREAVYGLVLTNCQLEANIWSYYNSTQPQHMSVFEQKLKDAISRSTLDPATSTGAFADLIAYPDLSFLEHEQLDWLELLSTIKTELKTRIRQEELPPKLDQLLKTHFAKYKTLQLGDGNWVPNYNHLKNQLAQDLELTDTQIKRRLNDLKTKPQTVRDNRARLLRSLGLTDRETHYANVLSVTGHIRLKMRSEGFIPLAYGEDQPIVDILANHYHTTGQVFRSLTYDELRALDDSDLDLTAIERRVDAPYLLVVDNGSYKTLFGQEAQSAFDKLVPEVALQRSDQIQGNSAMSGVVTGTALVYRWGDELPTEIPDSAILVTGQTRPQLLPLIRKCVGVVTDEGGLMSHAAIVARELNLPCVVGAKDATKLLHTGDLVELDATAGVLRVHDRSHSEKPSSKMRPTQSQPKRPSPKPAFAKTPVIDTLLLRFDQITGEQRGQVGGKGNSLAAMHRAGLPVPPGFVITTEAYRKLHDHRLPKNILDEFTEAFDGLGTTRVAVRSSAVAEDASDSSWAGQFETVLNVTRDGLEDAIQTCWESAASDIVAGYAKHHKVNKSDLDLALVVQAMIDSEVAGVAFTKNPVTGDSGEIMIEACFGLGELLVQGEATPDNFVVDKKHLKIKQHSHYEQAAYLTYSQGHNSMLPVSDSNAPKLTDDQVIELARLATMVEDYFGSPQDIEWALNNQTFYLVQARPITT